MKRFVFLSIMFLLLITAICPAAKRFELKCHPALIEKSMEFCSSQVGVREATGKNDGKQVEEYLFSVGLPKGNPYCAAGQYYCFQAGRYVLGLPASEIPILRTGSTAAMFNHAAQIGKPTKPVPERHDLMFWITRGSYAGHVERITRVGKAGWVETIAFNTSSGNSGSQRDGGGVYHRKRNIKHFLGRMAVRGFIGFASK